MLDGHLLKYYSTSKDTQPNTSALGDLKGVVALPGCSVEAASPSDADGRQACMKITPKSRKIYYINAKDIASRDEWISAVRNNAQLGPGGGATPTVAAGGAGGSADDLMTPEEPDAREIKNSAKSSKLEDANVTLADFELLKVIGKGTYGKVMQVHVCVWVHACGCMRVRGCMRGVHVCGCAYVGVCGWVGATHPVPPPTLLALSPSRPLSRRCGARTRARSMR